MEKRDRPIKGLGEIALRVTMVPRETWSSGSVTMRRSANDDDSNPRPEPLAETGKAA